MIRLAYIVTIGFLFAAQAVAGPLQVVVQHSHGFGQFDHLGVFWHVHGHDDEAPAPNRSGTPQLTDASDFEEPHQHGGQLHGVTDAGITVARSNVLLNTPVTTAALTWTTTFPVTSIVIEATESPPPKTPAISFHALRGPPVS